MEDHDMHQFRSKRAASDMLEDALQHFDSIIDSTANGVADEDQFSEGDLSNDLDGGLQGVALLMEDLRNAVEATVDAEVNNDEEKQAFSDTLLRYISDETLTFYRNLFKTEFNRESDNDKVNRLQSENQSLSLHVSILTDQVDLQTEKLTEVESQLKEALSRLEGADARLQEEVAAKTSLETQKLQLMNEMSNYKIDLAQRQQQQKQEEANAAEAERRRLEASSRADQYKETIEQLEEELAAKDTALKEMRNKFASLPSANKLSSPDEGIVQDHDDKAHQQALQLRMPAPFATSTPVSNDHVAEQRVQEATNPSSLENSKPSESAALATPTGVPTTDSIRSQSLERLHEMRVGGDLKQRPRNDGLLNQGHMGGSSGALTSVALSSPEAQRAPMPMQGKSSKSSSTPNLAMTEVRPIDSLTGDSDRSDTPTRGNPHMSPFHQRKKHGFRKFFTSFKLRRSHSSSLEPGTMPSKPQQLPEEENFRRGGVRATAGPRLGWNPRDHVTQSQPSQSSKEPFQRWDAEMVSRWLVDIGLDTYVNACNRWVKTGDTLLRATNHELEKELGVRHPLHKKKLMLHLQQLAGGDDDVPGVAQMNALWVARWLDDVGLPQYKDAFHSACVDGRVLHHLTVGDAQKLKISNLFHLISLRRGIEKLRSCDFDPSLLRRRPLEEGENDDVSLWTNHRVMEWLRVADLAEYAPNLRGSGVHGALMVLEPTFTADTLASLLHIPSNKTLLRRHLAAKLEELLPEESNRLKAEKRKESAYQSLNISTKYKVGRRSFGGFGRFRGSSAANGSREFSQGEYVCPMSSSAGKTMSSHRDELEKKMKVVEVKEKRNAEAIQEDSSQSSENIEVVELNEKATREINAFSAQINTLTNNWTDN